jgi:hypothetical protein
VRAMLPMIRRKFHKTQRSILRGLKDSLESDCPRVDLTPTRSSSWRGGMCRPDQEDGDAPIHAVRSQRQRARRAGL